VVVVTVATWAATFAGSVWATTMQGAGAMVGPLGVKGLLLRGGQGGVEGFDGFATAIGLGGVLGTHGAHAVNALGRGQLAHVFVSQAGRVLAGLHGGHELGPGGFLRCGELELGLQGRHALGTVGTEVMLAARGFVTAGVVVWVHFVGGLWRGRGAGGRCVGGRRGGGLGQSGQGQCGQDGGGSQTVLEGEGHGEVLSGESGLGSLQRPFSDWYPVSGAYVTRPWPHREAV
jgi:hypothetical protein